MNAVGASLSPGNNMATVGAWLFLRATFGAVGAWPVSCASSGRHGGVACHLGPVWQPLWGRGTPLGRVCQPWGRGPFPGFRVAAVGAWPVPCAPYGRRNGVACPLGFISTPWGRRCPLGTVWTPWGRGSSYALPLAPWGHGQYPVLRLTAVGAWLVP